MNISNVSAAANYAAIPSARLTQLSSRLVVKQESERSSSCQANLITTSLFASDNSYTKEDAVKKQWNKQGTFNLYEFMNGGKVNLQDPDPSLETLQEFEKQLQANGIQKEVDWNGLLFDLKGIGFDADAEAYTIGTGDFSRKVNYLASRFVAAEDKIKSTTTGDAQKEQLKRLNEMYQNALSEIADGYSGIIGSFLEKNGVSGETEKIRSSIVSGVEAKIDEYRKGLSDNIALENLKGTSDQWMLDDDAYVASVLRESTGNSSSTDAKAGNSPYTLTDLDALGQYASSLSSMEKPNNANIYTMDEARIGLDFSMLAMKTDALQKSGKLSDAMSGLLQNTIDAFMQSFLNRLDDQLSVNRNAGIAPGDEAGFASLDRNMIWDVYNQTMQQYRTSGDAVQAFITGAKYGEEKVYSQSVNGAYRYQNNISYWSEFFSKNPRASQLGGYESSDSTFQKYLAGWTDFKNSLESNKSIRLNLDLNTSGFYGTEPKSIISRII